MRRPLTGAFEFMSGVRFQGNLRVLAVTGMTTGTYVTMLNALLQPFIVGNLGFGVLILGVLVAFGARNLGIASSIVQPFGGHLADIFGRKPLILLGSAVGILSMLCFLIAATSGSLPAAAAGYLLFGMSLVGYPATQAVVAESAEMDARKVQVAFSVVFFFTYLPGVFVPAIGGYVATAVGYAVLFVAAALLELANLVVLIAALEETRAPQRVTVNHPARQAFSFKRALGIPRGLARVYLPFALDAFSFGIGGAIIYGFWTSAFGYSASDVGLVASVLSASIVASQYFATRILLRFGTRMTLAFSEFLTVVVLTGWLFVPVLPVVVAMAVIFGFSVSTWLPSLSSLLMTTAPVEERGSVAGKLAAFRGLISAPAPLIGGFLFTSYGYFLPVALSLVGEAITVVALLRLLPR